MTRTAKLFMNGRSQAVRLPAEFRFNVKEVTIRKDPTTGDVILSARKDTWKDWLKRRDEIPAEEREQFNPRPARQITKRGDPFAGWQE